MRISLIIFSIFLLLCCHCTRDDQVETSIEAHRIYEQLIEHWGTPGFEDVLEHQDDELYRDALYIGLVDDDYVNRLFSNMALFLVRDEPETRLRYLLSRTDSDNSQEMELARYLLSSYLWSDAMLNNRRRDELTPATGTSLFYLDRDGDDDFVPIIVEFIDNADDSDLKAFGLELLHEFSGEEAAIRTAIRETRDPDPEVRVAAVMALQDAKSELEDSERDDAYNALARLTNDPDRGVRRSALFALRWQSRYAELIDFIAAEMSDSDSEVKQTALDILCSDFIEAEAELRAAVIRENLLYEIYLNHRDSNVVERNISRFGFIDVTDEEMADISFSRTYWNGYYAVWMSDLNRLVAGNMNEEEIDRFEASFPIMSGVPDNPFADFEFWEQVGLQVISDTWIRYSRFVSWYCYYIIECENETVNAEDVLTGMPEYWGMTLVRDLEPDYAGPASWTASVHDPESSVRLHYAYEQSDSKIQFTILYNDIEVAWWDTPVPADTGFDGEGDILL